MTRLLFIFSGVILTICLSKFSVAEPIYNSSYHGWDKLFTTEVRVDQSLPGGQQRGNDIFLRKGATYDGTSANFDYLPYDTNNNFAWYKQSFNWSLSKKEVSTEFTFADTTLNITSATGTWEGLGIFLDTRDRSNVFYDGWMNVNVASWNDEQLNTGYSYRSNVGQSRYIELFDDSWAGINQLAGTIDMHWRMNYRSYYYGNTSPGSSFAFYLKGLDYSNVDFKDPSYHITDSFTESNINIADVPTSSSSAFGIIGIGLCILFSKRPKQKLMHAS